MIKEPFTLVMVDCCALNTISTATHMGLILSSIDFIKVHTSRLWQRKVFCPVIDSLIRKKKFHNIFFSVDKIDEDEKKPKLNEGDKKMKQSHLGFALVFVFV